MNRERLHSHFKLQRLRAYRKEWDEQRGVWKDRPRHDEASHAADGFMTFACSDFPEKESSPPARSATATATARAQSRHQLDGGSTNDTWQP